MKKKLFIWTSLVLTLFVTGLILFFPAKKITDTGYMFGVFEGCKKKGLFFKTIECSINMGEEIGLNQKFMFSIENPKRVKSILPLAGKRVQIKYVKIGNSPIYQGETPYRMISMVKRTKQILEEKK